ATELYKALERAFEDSSLGETPVVCNLPSSDLLSRYMDLPSDNPSKHADFVGQEAQANIPIAYDLLSTGYYIFEKARESSVSQVAMLTALRKTDVEARESMFKQLKVNLVGMLAEPVANYNALKHLNYLGEVNPGSAEAIMMVDVGHVRTNIQFFTSFGSWFRTIDWGIESLSQALAVGLKITHKDGDGVRRNIMRSKSVSESMGFLREACTVPKREIERSVRAATEQLKELEVVESILVGGGVYQPFLGSLLNNEDL
ncbi:MAG: pilus assembly protein PilM, partial [Planctomycetota bacterium]